MQRKSMILVGMICAVLVLSACSRNTQPQLLNVKSNQDGTPDEFSVLPSKPLTLPDDYTALPTPTKGGTNRTDVTPLEDAVVALGGNPNAGISDGGLVNYASRYGTSTNIRGELATEDLEFRRKNNGLLLERVFNVNVYFKAYRKQSLDQYAELERLRRLGVRTNSAPPEGAE